MARRSISIEEKKKKKKNWFQKQKTDMKQNWISLRN